MNESHSYTFKTTLNCDGCVARVRPKLEAVAGITAWQVDTLAAEKWLLVQASRDVYAEVEHVLKSMGFEIEKMDYIC